MRYLVISDVTHELSEEKAQKLLSSGAVYQCGEDHDLHLTPDHSFTLGDIELLLDCE